MIDLSGLRAISNGDMALDEVADASKKAKDIIKRMHEIIDKDNEMYRNAQYDKDNKKLVKLLDHEIKSLRALYKEAKSIPDDDWAGMGKTVISTLANDIHDTMYLLRPCRTRIPSLKTYSREHTLDWIAELIAEAEKSKAAYASRIDEAASAHKVSSSIFKAANKELEDLDRKCNRAIAEKDYVSAREIVGKEISILQKARKEANSIPDDRWTDVVRNEVRTMCERINIKLHSAPGVKLEVPPRTKSDTRDGAIWDIDFRINACRNQLKWMAKLH